MPSKLAQAISGSTAWLEFDAGCRQLVKLSPRALHEKSVLKRAVRGSRAAVCVSSDEATPIGLQTVKAWSRADAVREEIAELVSPARVRESGLFDVAAVERLDDEMRVRPGWALRATTQRLSGSSRRWRCTRHLCARAWSRNRSLNEGCCRQTLMLLHESDKAALQAPDQLALVAGTERLTFRELDDRVERLAAGLQARGICRGDRVVIYLENGAEAAVAWYAVMRAGGTFILVNPLTKHDKAARLFCCRMARQRADNVRDAIDRCRSGGRPMRVREVRRRCDHRRTGRLGSALPSLGVRAVDSLTQRRRRERTRPREHHLYVGFNRPAQRRHVDAPQYAVRCGVSIQLPGLARDRRHILRVAAFL